MAVNLSGVQLAQHDIVGLVADSLDTSGLPRHCLELEITESVLMVDAPAAVTILLALKALGVGLSVDDFRTGYSSLSYLKRFPVDVLKIDKSFVDGLGVDAEDSAIVEAITSLSNVLNLTALAGCGDTYSRWRASSVARGRRGITSPSPPLPPTSRTCSTANFPRQPEVDQTHGANGPR